MDGLNVPTELFAHHVVGQQLLLDALGVGLRLVALVHRHNHRNCHTTVSDATQTLGFDCQVPLLPLALLACWMDSTVWSMTPSSAATTRMMMSVALAPRALIEEKAA